MKPSRDWLGRLSGVVAACVLSLVVGCSSSNSGGTGGSGTGGSGTGGLATGGSSTGGGGASGGQGGGTGGQAQGGGGTHGGGQGGMAGHVADGGHGGVGGQAGAGAGGQVGGSGSGGGGGHLGGSGGGGGQGGQGGGDVCSNPVEGAACASEGKVCGTCTSACQPCNQMVCQSGHWARREAFAAPCFDCGSNLKCQQNAQYCRITEGGASGSSPSYACMAVPSSCATPPTCSCLANAPGQCTEISSGALSKLLQVP